jgi:diamine N-acetyltransferase
MTINRPLKGERIELRALEPGDLENLYAWENDTEIWNISETLAPISKFILKRYLENAHKDIFATRQLRLIIQYTETGKPIGTIDLFDFDPFHRRAAVGILIADKSERKKGIATEALGLLKHYCFEILKVHQLYCTISKNNPGSLELFRKAGFKITGTREKWNWDGTEFIDEYFLQLLK